MSYPEDIKSYYDLLDPRLKGKITMNDPTTTGQGFNTFSTLIFHKALDLDYFRQLVRQEPLVLRDQRLQVDWLAKGKYPVALWARDPHVVEYMKEGAPIYYAPHPKEGGQLASGGSAISLINRAAHPNAARVFINWLLSKEGQKHMQDFNMTQSAREDVTIEALDPIQVRRPGEKFLLSANNVEEWLLHDQDRYLDMAKELFAPLIK